MTGVSPTTTLDERYSSPNATATPWGDASELVERAEVYWLTTVRPDGRPHTTPVIAVWLDDALYFATGPNEHKAQNLAKNAHTIVTTGRNTLDTGLDLVVEGNAVQVSDESLLQRLVDAYVAKYGKGNWDFSVRDSAFDNHGYRANVYEVRPTTAYGYGKGATFSHTRWRF